MLSTERTPATVAAVGLRGLHTAVTIPLVKGAELKRHLREYVLPRMPPGTHLVGRDLVVGPVDWLDRAVHFEVHGYENDLPGIVPFVFPLWQGKTHSHLSYSLDLPDVAVRTSPELAPRHFAAIADLIVERALPWLERHGTPEGFVALVARGRHADRPEHAEALALAGRPDEALAVARRSMRLRGTRLDPSKPHEWTDRRRLDLLVDELERGAHAQTLDRLRAERDSSVAAMGLEPGSGRRRRPRPLSNRELRALITDHVMPALPEFRLFVQYGLEIRPRGRKGWIAREIVIDPSDEDVRGFAVVARARPRLSVTGQFFHGGLASLHVGGPGHVWHVDPGEEARVGAVLRDAVLEEAVPFLEPLADPGELGRAAVAQGAPERDALARELTAYSLFLGGDHAAALEQLGGHSGWLNPRIQRMRHRIERNPAAALRQLEDWRDS